MMKYFEALKRNLLITATTHGGEEILNQDYKPENNDDSQELFKQKQYFHVQCFQQSTTK